MELEITHYILLIAFVIAFVMGMVANMTNFCTMGAVSDWVNMGDTNRMRAWFLAITVALCGVLILEATGYITIDPSLPPYRSSSFAWLRFLIGGLLFGVGMTLASGCGNKTLVRLGAGNLKSLVVLIIAGMFAFFMTKTALYEVAFHPWVNATSINLAAFGMDGQDIGNILAGFVDADATMLRSISGGLLVLTLLVVIFRSADFRQQYTNIVGGSVIGMAVVAGWIFTAGPLGDAWKESVSFLDEIPAGVASQSLTFINPMGEAFFYAMHPGNTLLISFGMMALAGVVTGSFCYAMISRSFRIEWFSSVRDLVTHLIGAVLMGIGGVLAMGCTIGQGITGVSTLAVGSILALAAIIAGSALTMKVQYQIMMRAG